MREKIKLLENHTDFLAVDIYVGFLLCNIGSLKMDMTACGFF